MCKIEKRLLVYPKIPHHLISMFVIFKIPGNLFIPMPRQVPVSI